MAKRKVRRAGSGGRQAIVKSYAEGAWYDLPYWLKDWLVANSGWLVLAMAVVLAPAALLAVVLGFYALPLDYVGLPVASSDNSVGLATVTFITEFVFLLLAVRPLLREERKGWYFVIGASMVQAANGIMRGHGIGNLFFIALAIYLYRQLRPRLT